MLSLFLWQASAAVDKYRSGLTSLQERLQDSGTIHYPRGVQNKFQNNFIFSTFMVYLVGKLKIFLNFLKNLSVLDLIHPSITFCTKYIWEGFPGVLELLNNNKSLNFNDIKHFAQRNSWSREKVFSFVSHQNVVENKSFPCNTLRGSKTGKPCSFPFTYQSMSDQADNTSVG